MRPLVLSVMIVALAACKGPPARLVAGTRDTVIVNNRRPVQLPVKVLDKAGRVLPDTGVRYLRTSGVQISVSPTGVVTCTQPGDAIVRASLGSLATDVIVQCRPVKDVHALRMMNLVVGGPPQDLAFEAVDDAGRPVTLLTGQVIVGDSNIVSVDGTRVRALKPGSTMLTMHVGDRRAYMSVHAYERVSTIDGIQPGQHVAVPVRLANGEMRRWEIVPSKALYFLAMLPDSDEQHLPGLSIVGASCGPGLGPHTYFCLAKNGATVTVYHPQGDSSQQVSGTLAVWLQKEN